MNGAEKTLKGGTVGEWSAVADEGEVDWASYNYTYNREGSIIRKETLTFNLA